MCITPHLPYSQEKNRRYPLIGGGGASVDAGLREKSAAIPGNQTSDNFLACSMVTIVT